MVNSSRVIFVGGVGCCGKTTFAQSIMQQLNIPYVSVDHLMMGLYRSQPNCPFTPEDSSKKLAKYLWPLVSEMAKTNIENHHSIVFEGFQLLPEDIVELPSPYFEQTISAFIGLSPSYITAEFDRSIARNRNSVERRDFSEESPQQLIKQNLKLKQQCLMTGLPYFEVTTHYKNDIAKAYRYVEDQIHKANAFKPASTGLRVQ